MNENKEKANLRGSDIFIHYVREFSIKQKCPKQIWGGNELFSISFYGERKNRGEKCLACKSVGEDGFPFIFPITLYSTVTVQLLVRHMNFYDSVCLVNNSLIPSTQVLRSTGLSMYIAQSQEASQEAQRQDSYLIILMHPVTGVTIRQGNTVLSRKACFQKNSQM